MESNSEVQGAVRKVYDPLSDNDRYEAQYYCERWYLSSSREEITRGFDTDPSGVIFVTSIRDLSKELNKRYPCEEGMSQVCKAVNHSIRVRKTPEMQLNLSVDGIFMLAKKLYESEGKPTWVLQDGRHSYEARIAIIRLLPQDPPGLKRARFIWPYKDYIIRRYGWNSYYKIQYNPVAAKSLTTRRAKYNAALAKSIKTGKPMKTAIRLKRMIHYEPLAHSRMRELINIFSDQVESHLDIKFMGHPWCRRYPIGTSYSCEGTLFKILDMWAKVFPNRNYSAIPGLKEWLVSTLSYQPEAESGTIGAKFCNWLEKERKRTPKLRGMRKELRKEHQKWLRQEKKRGRTDVR